MRWTTKKTKNIVCAILLSIYFVLLVVYLWSRIEIHHYRFLTVLDLKSFFILTVAVPCIPLAMWVLSIVTLRKCNERLTALLLILYIPVLLCAFFLAQIELLALPATCSYTSNVNDFGNLDATIARDLQLAPVVAFPEELPKEAEQTRYCYFYQSSSSDIVYIAVTWQVEDNQKFKALVQQYVTELCDGTTYNSGCLQEDSYYCNAVLMDNQTNKIGFVVTNREALLPSKVNDIIKTPADILN